MPETAAGPGRTPIACPGRWLDRSGWRGGANGVCASSGSLPQAPPSSTGCPVGRWPARSGTRPRARRRGRPVRPGRCRRRSAAPRSPALGWLAECPRQECRTRARCARRSTRVRGRAGAPATRTDAVPRRQDRRRARGRRVAEIACRIGAMPAAGITRIFPDLTEDLLLNLFHKGAQAQWTSRSVDWSTPLLLSDRQRLALARLLTPVYFGEQTAMAGASSILPSVMAAGEATAPLYNASLITDEGGHFQATKPPYPS